MKRTQASDRQNVAWTLNEGIRGKNAAFIRACVYLNESASVVVFCVLKTNCSLFSRQFLNQKLSSSWKVQFNFSRVSLNFNYYQPTTHPSPDKVVNGFEMNIIGYGIVEYHHYWGLVWYGMVWSGSVWLGLVGSFIPSPQLLDLVLPD